MNFNALITLTILLLVSATFSKPFFQSNSTTNCGYDSCPDLSDDFIHVHLVPHTHDDVGWLKNPQEYLFGARDDIQRADVNYILDTVVDELQKDSSRRFIYVEMYFFSHWWNWQTEDRQDQVRKLVNNGQLVFINGGWVMNDEAATHYNAIIDQMTRGLRFLNATFGECAHPKVAWHIDPFGHSKEQARLFAMMGFDSFFFGRLDYDDKSTRLATKRMEEVWHAGDADLFFGALYNGYNPPDGFCFDAVDCADDPIIDDVRMDGYNVPERVSDFIAAVNDQAQHYRTNHIIMTMGSDFQYMVASKWYDNLDRLIKYVNAQQSNGSKINLLYSTPTCYTYSLNKANITWTTKRDDFFPYASDPHSYWTGYFTSRPGQKGYIRYSNNLLQIVRQLTVISQSDSRGVELLEGAMGVNQHHDAVTGTEKQAVQDFYMKLLDRGVVGARDVIQGIFNVSNMDFCAHRNISVCPTSENESKFKVVIYNPLARDVDYIVRMPVSEFMYFIYDSNNQSVYGDIVSIRPSGVLEKLRAAKGSDSQFELSFPVTLKGLSTHVFTVEKSSNFDPPRVTAQYRTNKQFQDVVPSFRNEYFTLKHKDGSFYVTTRERATSEVKVPSFGWYHVSKGEGEEPASGAYCFRPLIQKPFVSDYETMGHESGKHSQNYILNYPMSWVSGVLRTYTSKPYIEFEWLVGPIPVEDGIAKEIVVLYNTSISNNKTFHTDANGRQIIKRVLNYRPTWDFQSSEPTSQNYYPINSRIYIRNESIDQQFTVTTDRSEGGTSMRDGQVEVMLHRRDLADDGFGVGEALNETGQFGTGLIVRGVHRLLISSVNDSARLHRLTAEELYMQPLVAFYVPSESEPEPSFPDVGLSLPDNIHLLTLKQIDGDPKRLLLRLEHQFEIGEDSEYSQSVTLDLTDVFANMFTIKSARALVLSADRYADESARLQWQDTEGVSVDPDWTIDGMSVTLNPMEIKTIELLIE